MSHIIAVGLSTTLQKTIVFSQLKIDSVNRSSGYRLDASGKAINAARVLGQLSPGIVTNMCPLGEDNADFFLELAEKDALKIDWVPVPGRVRYCYTLLEPGTGRATELVVGEPVANADFTEASQKLLERIEAALPRADALLLAGSRPASFPNDLSAQICRMGYDAGCIVMADFHGRDLLETLKLTTPTIIKINEEEFCGTFGLLFPLSEEKLSRELAERSGALGNTIVITRGSKDTFAASNGIVFRQKVNAVTAVNAIGCGDSFTAGFLYSWLKDKDTGVALAKGGECATLNALNLRPGSIRDPGEKTEQLWY